MHRVTTWARTSLEKRDFFVGKNQEYCQLHREYRGGPRTMRLCCQETLNWVRQEVWIREKRDGNSAGQVFWAQMHAHLVAQNHRQRGFSVQTYAVHHPSRDPKRVKLSLQHPMDLVHPDKLLQARPRPFKIGRYLPQVWWLRLSRLAVSAFVVR